MTSCHHDSPLTVGMCAGRSNVTKYTAKSAHCHTSVNKKKAYRQDSWREAGSQHAWSRQTILHGPETQLVWECCHRQPASDTMWPASSQWLQQLCTDNQHRDRRTHCTHIHHTCTDHTCSETHARTHTHTEASISAWILNGFGARPENMTILQHYNICKICPVLFYWQHTSNIFQYIF